MWREWGIVDSGNKVYANGQGGKSKITISFTEKERYKKTLKGKAVIVSLNLLANLTNYIFDQTFNKLIKLW